MENDMLKLFDINFRMFLLTNEDNTFNQTLDSTLNVKLVFGIGKRLQVQDLVEK